MWRTYKVCLGVFLAGVVLAGSACGGTNVKSDCNDGLDNDGDGFIDDADPGCELNNGQLETPDPPPPPPKACGNGEDDDGDGLVDLADPGCENEADTDETDPPPQCNDAIDNNGDGRMDFPGDPGCDSLLDEVEDTVTTICSNGLDDDGDLAIDYPDDVGCLSASDNDESNQVAGICSPNIAVQALVGGEANGVLPSGFNDLQSPDCGGLGAEAVFTIDVATPSALIISTDHPETTADTIVYVRADCREEETELDCNDDGVGATGNGSTVILPDVPPGLYYIIVDGYPGDTGAFKLTVDVRVGAGGPCDPLVPDVCLAGYLCRPLLPGDPNTCELPECQDGFDNDSDGTTDYPDEAGCATPTDNTELIPAGDPLPACANLLDDDADTLIDYPADPGCTAASDGVEIDECIPGKLVSFLDPVLGADGTTVGDTMVLSGSCGGIDGPEDVYAITPLVVLTSMTIDTVNPQTSFDTILYVREELCASPAAEVACNDNAVTGISQSSVTFVPTTGNTYFVFVDGSWTGPGAYHVDVSGVIAGGGVCDPAIPSYTCESGFACRESTLGAADWLCRVALCSDTIDNDGDSFTDFPNDPGCATPSDDAEDFPNPVTACSDGLDNDGDGFIDYAGGDIGCASAADDAEIDECTAGVPVIDHPGGLVTGTTVGGTNALSAPVGCDSSGSSGTSPEQVYVFNNTMALTNLRFSTAGSAIDNTLYVRYNDCGVAGPLGNCNNGAGTGSDVNIASPAVGNYFAVIDGVFGGVGSINLSITGTIAGGAACTAGDPSFVCATGYDCTGGVCAPAACNDGADNDGDGDVDYPFDPGCTSISDGDETDPVPTPACGDGLDNDADGTTDYPADDSCASASDDNEACSSFGTDTFGYQGCQDTLGMVPACDDIVATGLPGCTGDDCNFTVVLPFTFDFYGVGQTSLGIGSNGKIGFPGSTIYSNTCTIESNTIAVYWDDLFPPGAGATGTFYQTLGTAPNRRFVVNWRIPHISGGTNYDLRAVLWEGTNDIDVCYVDTITNTSTTDLGASATTGIQGTSTGLQFSCNTGTVTEGLHLHYDHP